MGKKTTSTLAILVLACFMADGARGDTGTDPYAGVAVEQVFDSNVQNALGSDFVTRITPRLGFLVDGPRVNLDVDYRLGIFAYAQGTASNSFNHRGSIVGKAAVSPRFDVDTRLLLTIGEDPIMLDLPGIAVPPGGYTNFEGHLGGRYRASRRLTLDAAYLFRRSDFDLSDVPSSGVFDGDEHRVDVGAGWQVSRRLTLRGTGRYQHFITYNGPIPTLDAAGGGAAIDYAFTSTLFGHVDAGPLWLSTDDVTWVGRIHLASQGERTRYTLAAFRDFYGGTGTAQASWTEAVTLQGAFSLTRALSLRVRGAGYRNGFGPGETADVTGILARGDVGWTFFKDNMRIELYGEHRLQNDEGAFAIGDIHRTVVGLRLVAVAGVDISSLGDNP